MTKNEDLVLYSTERDRIVTDIAIEREALPKKTTSIVTAPLKTEGDQIEAQSPGNEEGKAAASEMQFSGPEGTIEVEDDASKADHYEFKVEHRRDVMFQDQDQARKATFIVRSFGICISYEKQN